MMKESGWRDIADHLQFLYGDARLSELLGQLHQIVRRRRVQPPADLPPLSEKDSLLITYGDQLTHADELPLRTLARTLKRLLSELLSGVHILPFYPYSSDDGFSVIDYYQVDQALGTWGDVAEIAGEFRLMLDAVINHISVESAWFKGFLAGEPEHLPKFIEVDPGLDLSEVVRPRDLPLLTPFMTSRGERHIWTTFSADQVDLNYRDPALMLEILDLLLFYVQQGAQLIRLDAIAFLWKDPTSPSIHLPQTHRIVQLMRAVLDVAAPWVLLITETNVPHKENVAYFESGADLVYQFALPPLVLHTMLSGDTRKLSSWAGELRSPVKPATFFNFLASHDGIGLRPVTGILTDEELQALVDLPERSGGTVSYRALADGGRSPYELNVTYFDAIASEELPTDIAVKRFLASQAIMLAMPGLPGIYFHSLFGSRNDLASVERTGQARSINRARLVLSDLEAALADPNSLRAQVFQGYSRLLRARSACPAFDPWARHRVLEVEPGCFAILREAQAGEQVVCLHEIAGHAMHLRLPVQIASGFDLIAGQPVGAEQVALNPYQVRWISSKIPDRNAT
jgi:sucrose phosphorylase